MRVADRVQIWSVKRMIEAAVAEGHSYSTIATAFNICGTWHPAVAEGYHWDALAVEVVATGEFPKDEDIIDGTAV